MIEVGPGDSVRVMSRYWDHGEPGMVVSVGVELIGVEIGGGVLKFSRDTGRITDPEWDSSMWIDPA